MFTEKDVIPPQTVSKTFVIGLGSTGTAICRQIAQRIEWEFGGQDQCPWIKFLCIETNKGEVSAGVEGDFITMSLDSSTFSQMCNAPEQYSTIGLRQWADMGTLRSLPDGKVEAGAGNIRMIGRLAFLESENFKNIKKHVLDRLRSLRELTVSAARQARGTRPSGSNEEISFKPGQDEIRIFVVGSLCGGTCSGTVSDFGLFLKTICKKGDFVQGAFTLPNPRLSASQTSNASRLKMNAKVALEELNHYAQKHTDATFPILYADETITHGDFYNDVFLCMPVDTSTEARIATEQEIADWIFLQSVAPELNAAAQSIDQKVIPSEGGFSNVFSLFGFGTLEFPAFTVIQGAQARALSELFRKLRSNSASEPMRKALLTEAGLDQQGILANISNSRQPSLDDEVTRRLRDALEQSAKDADTARRMIDEFRQEFQSLKVLGAKSDSIVEHVYKVAQANLQQFCSRTLLNVDLGSSVLALVLQDGEKVLSQVSSIKISEPVEIESEVNRLLSDLRRVQQDGIIKSFGLTKRVAEDLKRELGTQLQREFQERSKSLALRVLAGTPQNPGMAPQLQSYVKAILVRLRKIDEIFANDSRYFNSIFENCSENAPAINGVALFTPKEPGVDGTVLEEYERACRKEINDQMLPIAEIERRMLQKCLSTFTALAEETCKIDTSFDRDKLARIQNISSVKRAMPAEFLQEAVRTLRNVLGSIAQVNVIDRWSLLPENMDPVGMASSAVRAAKPKIKDSSHKDHAKVRQEAIMPQGSQQVTERLVKIFRQEFPGMESVVSKDPFRIILATSVIRFGLDRIPIIVGLGGLSAASCNDFPTFYTRKDVKFKPLPVQRLAEESEYIGLITVGLLTDLIKMEDGYFHFTLESVGEIPPVTLKFPYDIGKFSAMIRSGSDSFKQDSSDFIETLERRLLQLVNQVGGCKELLAHIDRRRSASGLSNIADHVLIPSYLTGFIVNNEKWLRAFISVRDPKSETKDLIRKRDQNDNILGYYCRWCGPNLEIEGLIGRTEEECKENLWRCKLNPEHYFGPKYE